MKLQMRVVVASLLVNFFLLTSASAAGVSQAQYGARDAASANLIENINQRASLRSSRRFSDLAANLLSASKSYTAGSYGKSRLLNELADVYSHNLLDIESAIKVDQELLLSKIPKEDTEAELVPRFDVANDKIINDKSYYKNYVKTASAELEDGAKQRLKLNMSLLEGLAQSVQKLYTRDFLLSHIDSIRNDIKSARISTRDRKEVLSRLIRADYELNTVDPTYRVVEFGRIISGEIPITDVDFSEISYLQLSNYLISAYKVSADIRLAEMALEVVYKPYVNIRASNARWKYNKIINDYISTLIDANFQSKRFDEMLYYTSLNKSRMLLEERLIFGGASSASTKMADFAADDGIPRSAFGLPDKSWFKTKLASSPQFLDFYVGGTYVNEKLAFGTKASRAELSAMPLNSRNSSRVRTDEPVDTFKDDALYLTQVNAGRVTAVKLMDPQLSDLRHELEQSYKAIASYEAISNNKTPSISPAFQKLKSNFQLAGNITVSPDKWVAAHPLDFHLQSQLVRSVNFFTSGESNRLDRIWVAGFFNPTLDLAGADGEAEVIQAMIPSASIVRREAARKSALGEAAGSNVIHLSMHGNFNAADPTLSKLVFAGAKNDDSTTDPDALYATEMASVPALRNRDLVFAAACQTGLAAADRTNSNELIGILRPLTANRNKNIILSLWNVSDQATGEFVKAFYQKLATTLDVTVSFHHAQDQLRAQYPHPYYWAAFYLSQAN